VVRRFTLAAAIVVLIGIPAAADACSCVIPGPSCQETWQADAVFVAQVLDISAMPTPRNAQSPPPFDMQQRVRLVVSEV
jgi:hypothetical protein